MCPLSPTEATGIRFDEDFCAQVGKNLSNFKRNKVTGSDYTPAAVTFVLVGDKHGNASFVLTRRPRSLRRHAGQWAIPGGRVDSGESIADAARREVKEEIGLDLAPDSILGILDDFPTRSGFAITPVVALGPEMPRLTPAPEEVRAIYLVPLHLLESPDIPSITDTETPGRPLISLPLPSLETTIWAPTAALIYQMREVVLYGRPTRVAHFEQPQWAWK